MRRFGRHLAVALAIGMLPSLAAAQEGVPAAAEQKAVPAPAASTASKPAVAAPAQQGLRFGYVDIARINQESDLGKSLQSQAKEKQKKLQTQLDSRKKQLDKQKAALQAKVASLTPDQREAKAKEFQKKVEEFQSLVLKSEKELQSLQEKLIGEMSQATEEAAAAYGKANGLALVVVKREMLYLASGTDAQDVTDGVLALLNGKKTK